jgi:hypothetical protein
LRKVFKAETLGLDFARSCIAKPWKVKEIGHSECKVFQIDVLSLDLPWCTFVPFFAEAESPACAGLSLSPDLRLSGVSSMDCGNLGVPTLAKDGHPIVVVLSDVGHPALDRSSVLIPPRSPICEIERFPAADCAASHCEMTYCFISFVRPRLI